MDDLTKDIEKIRQNISGQLDRTVKAEPETEWGSSGDGFILNLTREEMLEFHDRIWDMARKAAEKPTAKKNQTYTFNWLISPEG